MKKILMLTPTFFPKIGGIENHVYELSKRLNNCGYKVDIGVVRNSKHNIFEKYENLNVINIKYKGIAPFFLFNINKYIDIKQYDLIHVHDPHICGITFSLKLTKPNLPLILSSHGGIFHNKNKFILKKLYWNSIARYLGNIYKKIICVSKNDFDTYKTIFPEGKLVVIENGINIKKFLSIYDKFNKNKNFIYFGRLSPNKNILQLILIMKRVIEKDDEVNLYLIGESDNREYFNKIKNVIGNNNNIKLYKFLSDKELLDILSKCTFFISGSLYEGFGISIFEAMAAGRIVIMNDISPLNKIFVNREEIFFVNFNNLNETVNMILSLLIKDNTYLSYVRENALEKVNKYSWDNKIKEIIKLYERVINA